MQVQDLINQLLWDRRFILIPEDLAKPDHLQYVIIKDFSIEDRNYYILIKKFEEQNAKVFGVPSNEELINNARIGGYWTDEDDKIIDKAEDHIQFLKEKLKDQKSKSGQLNIQNQIDKTIEQKINTETKKHDLYINSSEYYAHEIATYTLVRRVVLQKDGSLLWPNELSLLEFKKNYFSLLIFLIQEVLSEACLDIKSIREIARSPEWRLIWSLQRKNLVDLFSRPIGNLTLNQKLVVYWSRIYDSAFESMEPPSMEIINNDNEFDIWLSNRETSNKEESNAKISNKKMHQEQMRVLDGEYIEICICGVKESNKGKGLGAREKHKAGCRYGIFRRYTQVEKDEISHKIYGRNSENVRSLINKEQNHIENKGIIEEQHLRGKKSREILGLNTKINTKHSR